MLRLSVVMLGGCLALGAVSLPVGFEPNRGQAPDGVRFVSHWRGGTLLLSESGAALRIGGSEVGFSLQGARPHPAVEPEERIEGVRNYLFGSDRSRWIRGLPAYRRVRYREVYPGIDLVFHHDAEKPEFDFVVAPGADPRPIRVAFSRAPGLRLDRDGVLRIDAGAEIACPALAYQKVNGRRVQVALRLALRRGVLRFEPGRYDRRRPLIMDPALVYGTYLGGGSRDMAGAVAVDAQGGAYLAGYTVSADFPITSNALQVAHGGAPNPGVTFGGDVYDVFVSKLSPDGSNLVYSTFLGGTGNDQALAIVVDADGNAVVAGVTSSPDFPLTAGAIQTTAAATGASAFVSKLNADGSDLLFSTYLGGDARYTAVQAIALDPSANVFVAGYTTVTVNSDAFVAKLTAAGTTLSYSKLLGGTKDDQAFGLAVDPAGNAYVAGLTTSSDFPVTAGAAQAAPGGNIDGFLAKIDPSGANILYSTFLGGSGDDSANSVALGPGGDIYVAGNTSSADFPSTVGAFQAALRSANTSDAFVMRLDASGAVRYSTLLGGSNIDTARSVAVAADGSALIAGTTNSLDLPLTPDAYQSRLTGENCVTTRSPFPSPAQHVPCTDAFLAIVHVSGRRLVYSTYLGGSGDDSAGGLALASSGAVYVAGATGSDDFITTRGAFRESRAGGVCTAQQSPTFSQSFSCEDAFVLKIDPNAAGGVRPAATVVNGITFTAGPVAPGEFVSLFGVGIGPSAEAAARLDENGQVANTLNGTTVTFGGFAAPLLYAGPNQINAIVPFEVASKENVVIRIDTPAYGANVGTVAVTAAAPAIVSMTGGGQGQAAALNQDGSVNGPDNPAAAGSIIVLFGTGAGQTSPAGATGRLAASPLPRPVADVTVRIGGSPAQILYAGAAPGLVEGVIQVNALIPAGIAPGPQVPVVLTANGVESQPDVFIAVR